MAADPLDDLLETLCRGDAQAAKQVFEACEPYLRKVVRRRLPRQLRSKFDSMDIVQSIWADLLVGFREAGWKFADAAHLRAFLVKVTRHRFIDRQRQHRRATERERPLDGDALNQLPPAASPQPWETVQANELWEQMLQICPQAHRPLLAMRRQGLSVPEIAAQSGLHEDSVRRILRDVARRLARRQNSSPGPRAEA
jgi:RNA polymerase sigma-70 factor (ECF subfamily)